MREFESGAMIRGVPFPRIAAALLVAAGLVVLGFAALPARAAPGDPPYEPQLQRLSEILGALHYLRPLCGAAEGSVWRDQMEALIAAEQPTPERRGRMVSRFNQGYRSFASVYRSCTPAASFAIERYTEEGARISRDIASRYGR